MEGKRSFDGGSFLPPVAGLRKRQCRGGDAFCAGCLYAIHCGMDAVSMLRFGAAAAAANLSAVDAVSGMKSADELAVMINTWEIRENETI